MAWKLSTLIHASMPLSMQTFGPSLQRTSPACNWIWLTQHRHEAKSPSMASRSTCRNSNQSNDKRALIDQSRQSLAAGFPMAGDSKAPTALRPNRRCVHRSVPSCYAERPSCTRKRSAVGSLRVNWLRRAMAWTLSRRASRETRSRCHTRRYAKVSFDPLGRRPKQQRHRFNSRRTQVQNDQLVERANQNRRAYLRQQNACSCARLPQSASD